MAIKFQQAALFDAATLGLPLPTVGEQKDIRYFGTIARSILNGPETTGMGFWSINPYIGCAFGCAYCYARYAHRYAVDRNATANPDHEGMQSARDDLAPWLAFERRIFVKQNAADVLRKVLRHGSDRHTTLLQGDSIVIGTATDPFQPAERRFRITRSVLEVLADHPGLTICIITKSPLITRDIDLLRRIDRISKLSLHISLITVDRELARRLEPRAPTPEARLRAIARLRENGLETGINVMPVLPAITDDIEQLEDVVRAVASRGASYVGACALRLQASARLRYLPFIEQEFPHLSKRYRATYAFDDQVSGQYSEKLKETMRMLCDRHGIQYGYGERSGRATAASRLVASVVDQLELGID